jgi:hypothetical protein
MSRGARTLLTMSRLIGTQVTEPVLTPPATPRESMLATRQAGTARATSTARKPGFESGTVPPWPMELLHTSGPVDRNPQDYRPDARAG